MGVASSMVQVLGVLLMTCLPVAAGVQAARDLPVSQISYDTQAESKLRGQAEIRRFAVGICFAASPKNPSGTYWVLMAFY